MAGRVVHATVTGAAADSTALVDGPAWDADHVITGMTIGTDVQAHDSTLDTLSGKSTTGTGKIVLDTSPTLVTPALGTPTSGVATNLTGTASGLTAGGNLVKTSNLSDVSNTATSRFNLGAVGVVRIQKFAGSGTYTPNANMLYCIIECVGGGGGGGATVGSATGSRGGGGGGSGGYSIKVASSATIGSSQTVTVGAGGNGGSAGTNAGAAGGDTSVGALCIAKGGSGGNYNDQSVGYGEAGAGAIAGTGDFTGVGQYGSVGLSASITTVLAIGGLGGVPVFGGGAPSRLAASGSNLAGFAATGVGGGGGGAGTCGVAANSAGGNGGTGYVIITEFCSQ